ncbi:MAG: hypothetical protein E6700_01325 [Winkia neuii]|nr:hypothetical protein [Winkia neuii]KWZ74167.1 hypothetical protein HMPREF3198_00724 [Winkia neuii]MDK8098601.1 hypothetical protein [Winkia neuii]MDU3134199.1 hypothetical protein [Winkia neuii]
MAAPDRLMDETPTCKFSSKGLAMKHFRQTSLPIIAATAMALTFAGTANATSAIEEVRDNAPHIAISEDNVFTSENLLHEGLSFIESIPNSALKNDTTFKLWKQKNLFHGSDHLSPKSSIGACAWGISKAVASNVFVFSKVLKIKKVLKAAGGAKALASKAIAAYKAARAANKSKGAAIAAASEVVEASGGEQAVSLMLELFSLDGVVSGCFL